MAIQTVKDFEVYRASYQSAMDIFWATRTFPKEELYSLTSQLCRASRSVPGNIAAGGAKRHFVALFRRHLIDAMGSCEETKHWLETAHDCEYLADERYGALQQQCTQVSKMLWGLHKNWHALPTDPAPDDG